jgi:vacuolar-type H+-ATPase subunit C/Vma6
MAAIPSSGVRSPLSVPLDFLAAKLRGRRSRLYEGDRLRDLARQRSLGELAWLLYPREEIRRPLVLERRLLSDCVADLASLLKFLDGAYCDFYRALLNRYAVENLKVLLRLWWQGGVEAGAGDYLIELPRRLRLPRRDLLTAGSPEGFVAAVPLKEVRECALELLPRLAEDAPRACLEMAFDKGYWRGVWHSLPRGARAYAAPVQHEFDAMRLLGTLRAARHYGLSWSQWEPLLPDGPGGLSEATLRSLHADPRLEFVIGSIRWLGPEAERLRDEKGGPSLGRLEEALWRRLVRTADRQYYCNMTGPAVLIAYFYLKRNELRELLGIAQMVRYGWPESDIVEYLDL